MIRWPILIALLLPIAARAESLTGIKSIADAKGAITLSTLLASNISAAAAAAPSPRANRPKLDTVIDKFLQSAHGPQVSSRAALLPAAGFKALTDTHTFTPPDTNGAVGPNHVMTALNIGITVQDKSGSSLGFTTLQSFWEHINPGGSVFDPRLLYDGLSNRWIFSSMANAVAANSALLIAVSNSTDPTGAWTTYRIKTDAAGKTWIDFPGLGVNKDWIVFTGTKVGIKSGQFVNMNYYVFDKADLLSAGTGKYTLFPEAYKSGQNTERLACPSVVTDPQHAKIYVVESSFPNNGTLRVSEVAGSVGAETFNTATAAPLSPITWSARTPQTDLAPQAGSSVGIDTNDAIVHNTVYRNGFLWCAQSIYLPADNPTRIAVQWWQFTPEGALQQSGVIDDPSGNTMAAFPSVAVNQTDDALIGYTRFSSTNFASSCGSMRLGTDALGTMRPELRLKSGEAPYVINGAPNDNRWGDYSAACVDPANDTDLWTLQEYASPNIAGSDRWSTWWSRVVPRANATSDLVITPNPASVGRSVQFTIGAPGTAVIAWDFGDGNTQIGASVSHTYITDGNFTISVAVTDAGGSFDATVPLQVFVDTDGNGIPDLAETDSDNDGFTNAIESLAGTSPTDANSTPVANQPAVVESLTITKVSFKFLLNGKTGSNVQISGTLPVPNGFTPNTQTVYVDCLGIAAKHTLNAKGISATTDKLLFFTLSAAKKGVAKFKTGLPIDITTDENKLRHRGFDFFDRLSHDPRDVPINILFNNKVYQATSRVLLTIAPGKSGAATGKLKQVL